MSRILANTFYTIRPSACLGASLLAVASFSNLSDYSQSIVMFISVFAGSASCFLINDIADVVKDQLNKRQRPVATGELPLVQAKSIAVSFSVFYVLLSFSLGVYQLIICLFTLAIFMIYPLINHRSGFLANLAVAVCTILSMLYGGVPESLDPILYLLMASTFFVIISREIMLDVLDISGDTESGKNSLPIGLTSKRMRQAILIGYFLSTIPLLVGAVSYGSSIVFLFVASMASLWVPVLIHWKSEDKGFALFNVRTSHIFFALIIITLFVR